MGRRDRSGAGCDSRRSALSGRHGTARSSPSIYFEVYALGQSIRGHLAAAMAESPLTPEEYAIYSAIFEDERITPTAMARSLGMPLTTAMDHVARLEARGHARRTVAPHDRRATQITLTADGLAAHRGANHHFESANRDFAAALPVDGPTATEWLRTIRDAVDAAAARSQVATGRTGAPRA